MNLDHLLIWEARYQSFKRLCVALIFVLFGYIPLSHCQYNLSLSANYVYSFGEKTINVQNDTYRLNTTQGFEISANNNYRFPNTSITGIFEIGFRQLYFSGSSDNLIYSGQLNKLIAALGCSYSLAKNLNVAAYIEVENNLGFDDFGIGNGDLFRVSLSLESSYMVTERLGLTLLLSRAMTPISEAYIIYNPQYQVRFGLTTPL